MDRKELKKQSRKLISENYWKILSVSLMYSSISSVFSLISTLYCSSWIFCFLIGRSIESAIMNPSNFGILATWAFAAVGVFTIAVGFSKVGLKVASHEDFSISDVFTVFNYCAKIVVMMLVVMVKTLIIPATSILVTALYFMLFQKSLDDILGIVLIFISAVVVIFYIIKAIGYSMTHFILVENPEMKIKDILSRSQEIMKGHELEYIKFLLSFFWWYILGFITLGIVNVYVLAYCEISWASYYKKLSEETH